MVVFSIDTCFTCNDNSYVNHISSNVCEVGEKSLLKDVLNLLIDTGIPFENQGFVKTIRPFQGYLTQRQLRHQLLSVFNKNNWGFCHSLHEPG